MNKLNNFAKQEKLSKAFNIFAFYRNVLSNSLKIHIFSLFFSWN